MSSYSQPRMTTLEAGADLSSKQYHGVKFGSADDLVVAAAAEQGIGILMNQPTSGKMAEVALNGGGAKAKLAGTVARGDSLTPDADGAFVVAAAGERATCIAMASGVSGDVIAVEVNIHSVPA